jgi:osmotically-inducible protein OsmY
MIMKSVLTQAPADALREAIVAELSRDPNVDVWRIGIDAEDGVVTLTGSVEFLAMSVAAERAVKRVRGVRSIANDLHLRTANERADAAIAREALHRLRNNVAIPQTVQAVVHDGHVTLDGTVHWLHQRAAAESAVRYLAGVKSVANDITIIPPSR